MEIEQVFIDTYKIDTKDETDLLELDVAISPWNANEIEEAQEDIDTKCGEVFLTNSGRLTFVCIRCHWKFLDLSSFADHIADGPCEQCADLSSLEDSNEKDEIIPQTTVLDNLESYPDSEIEKGETVNEEPPVKIHLNRQSPRNGRVLSEESTSTNYQSEFEQKVLNEPNAAESIKNPTQEQRKRKPLKKELKVEEMPFCAACTRSFASGFRAHLKNKHSDLLSKEEIKRGSVESIENKIVQSLDKLECIYCNLVFASLEEFRLHAGMHLGRNLYLCKFCPKKFQSQYNRRLHMNSHEDSRPYKCTHCPKAFNNPHNLQKHTKLHSNNRINQFPCYICGRACITDSKRKVHVRYHTQEKPFQCEECGKRFITRLLLRYHKFRHQGIKNFKCSFCEKAFYTMPLLKGHLTKHTKERKFKCETCGEAFPRRNALSQHKLLHEEVKRYSCNVCGKQFAQYAGLYAHRRIHGEPLSKNLMFS